MRQNRNMIGFALAALLTLQTPRAITSKIALASMFKNGYVILVREMPVTGAGEHFLEKIPQASLGTLWLTTSGNMHLTSVKNVLREVSTTTQAGSFDEFLRLNVGKKVTLTTVNMGVITGTIVGVNGDTVLLKSENGETVTMIQRGEIRRIEFPAGAAYTITTNSRDRALQFTTDGSGSIYMISLERGMAWAPSYAVTLKDDKTLNIVGKATAMNDLEDLNGVEARFITGFPNLPFASLPEPLTMPGDMNQFMSMISGVGSPQALYRSRPNEMMMNQGSAAFDDKSFAASMPPSELGGFQAEDLFFYRQPNVHLKKGERAYFVVLTADAPYEELYTWDIDDFVMDATYRPTPPSDQREDIWHTIRFTNTAKMPFSTGAATIFKDNQMLGQDMMRYASVGGKAELKITKAVDISADQLEEETARERGALQNTYKQATHDLVTLQGTLTLVNRQAKVATVRVRKLLTGEVISTSPLAKVTKTARGLRDVNSRALVEWTQTVEPGKTVKLTYSYKVYIRV